MNKTQKNWGLGFGDWGLGIGDWGLGPIPNPQSPIPNPHPHKINLFTPNIIILLKNINLYIYFHIEYNLIKDLKVCLKKNFYRKYYSLVMEMWEKHVS